MTSAWPFQHPPGLLAEWLDLPILVLNHAPQGMQVGIGEANMAVSLHLSYSHHSNLVFIQMSYRIKLGPSQTATF